MLNMFSMVAGHFPPHLAVLASAAWSQEQMALWELKVKPAGATWRSRSDGLLPAHEMVPSGKLTELT